MKTSARDVNARPDELGEASLTIQFFQGELLGLTDETEDHKPGDKVEPGIKPN